MTETTVPNLAAFIPLLLAFAGTSAADEPAWNADYVVRFVTDGGAHRAEVEAVLRWNKRRGSAPDDVELEMASGYPGGYGAFVHELAAFVPEGMRAPKDGYAAEAIEPGEGRHRLPVLRDGRAAFRYVVPLAHDPATGIGWDETPHALDDAVLWTGRSLFVTPRDARIRVMLVPPDGEHVSTSLTLDPDEANEYLAVDARKLRETYLIVGRHLEHEIALQGATLLLVVDAGAAEAVELIESSVRTFVETATDAVGGPPPERCGVPGPGRGVDRRLPGGGGDDRAAPGGRARG